MCCLLASLVYGRRAYGDVILTPEERETGTCELIIMLAVRERHVNMYCFNCIVHKHRVVLPSCKPSMT